MFDDCTSLSSVRSVAPINMGMASMADTVTAKTIEPSPKGASSDAPMGRLMAVASRNMARTKRLLPATALALQVKLVQAIQIRAKRRTNSPNPSRVG